MSLEEEKKRGGKKKNPDWNNLIEEFIRGLNKPGVILRYALQLPVRRAIARRFQPLPRVYQPLHHTVSKCQNSGLTLPYDTEGLVSYGLVPLIRRGSGNLSACLLRRLFKA